MSKRHRSGDEACVAADSPHAAPPPASCGGATANNKNNLKNNGYNSCGAFMPGLNEMVNKLRRQRERANDAKANDDPPPSEGEAKDGGSAEPSRKRRKVNNDLGNDANISDVAAPHEEAGQNTASSAAEAAREDEVTQNGNSESNKTGVNSGDQNGHEEEKMEDDADDDDEDESEFDESDLDDEDDEEDEDVEVEGEDEDVAMDAPPTPKSNDSESKSAPSSVDTPPTSSTSITLPDTPAHKIIPPKVVNATSSRRSRRRNVSPDFEWESRVDDLHFKCVSDKSHSIAQRVEKDMVERFGEDTAEVTWDYLRKTQLKCGFAVLQPLDADQSDSEVPPLASAVVDLSMIDGKPALRIALVQTATDKQGLGFGRVMVASLEEMARRLMSSHLDRPGWPLVLVCASVEEEGLGGVALTFWQHKTIGYRLCEEAVPVPSDPPLVWTEARTDEFLMYSNNSKLMWKTIGAESEIELALAVHREKKRRRASAAGGEAKAKAP